MVSRRCTEHFLSYYESYCVHVNTSLTQNNVRYEVHLAIDEPLPIVSSKITSRSCNGIHKVYFTCIHNGLLCSVLHYLVLVFLFIVVRKVDFLWDNAAENWNCQTNFSDSTLVLSHM